MPFPVRWFIAKAAVITLKTVSVSIAIYTSMEQPIMDSMNSKEAERPVYDEFN